MTYPPEKLLDWCPTKYLWIGYGDNDFYWAAKMVAEILVDRLTSQGGEPLPIEYVQQCVERAMPYMKALQESIGYRDRVLSEPDNYFKNIRVEYVDIMKPSQEWNSEDVYIDSWTGEIHIV